MRTLLTSIFSPPKVTDPAQAHVARQLHYLLLLGLPIALTFLVMDEEVRAGVPKWNDLIAGGVGLVIAACLPLLHRGYLKFVSYLLMISCLGAIGLASYYNIGVRNPSMIAVPVLLMVCSILLGSRTTTLFAIVMASVATFLYFYERSGVYYPQPLVVDTNYWLVNLLLIGMTTVVLHLTINQIVQSEKQIRQQAEELHNQNKRLEQIQLALEARTQELTRLNASLQLEMAERARTEAALHQKQKLESVGLLAGGVAHDFNNLLSSILNQCELAMRRMNDNNKARGHVEKAIHSTQRAADLTRQLLAYAGKARFQIEPLDVNQLIRANDSLLETVIQRNSLLQLRLHPALPFIISDSGQIQQIVLNLVMNAAESIEHDHGEIVIATSVVSWSGEAQPSEFVNLPPSPGDYVCLEIADNGMGMKPEMVHKIFDPFFSTKERGHGLGLSAVLGVVKALHGGLQVESRPCLGSTFRVYLPISDAEPQLDTTATPLSNPIVPNSPAQLQPPYLSKHNGVILVIDDEAAVRETIVDMLDSVGYQTLVATNGYDGLAHFETHREQVAAIVLDVVMPGIDGLETLRRVRAVDEQIPVILCSGYSDAAFPDSLLKHPATSFLAKPYTLQQLITKLTLLTTLFSNIAAD